MRRQSHDFDFLFCCLCVFFSRAVTALLPTYAVIFTRAFIPADNSTLFWFVHSFSYGARVCYHIVPEKLYRNNRFREDQNYLFAVCGLLALMPLHSYVQSHTIKLLYSLALVILFAFFNACQFPKFYSATIQSQKTAVKNSLMTRKQMYSRLNWMSAASNMSMVAVTTLESYFKSSLNYTSLLLASSGMLLFISKEFFFKKRVSIFDNLDEKEISVSGFGFSDILLILGIVFFNETCSIGGKWCLEYSQRTGGFHEQFGTIRSLGLFIASIIKLFCVHHLISLIGTNSLLIAVMNISIVTVPLTFLLSGSAWGSIFCVIINYLLLGIYSTIFLFFLSNHISSNSTHTELGFFLNFATSICHLGTDFLPSFLCYGANGSIGKTLYLHVFLNTVSLIIVGRRVSLQSKQLKRVKSVS